MITLVFSIICKTEDRECMVLRSRVLSVVQRSDPSGTFSLVTKVSRFHLPTSPGVDALKS